MGSAQCSAGNLGPCVEQVNICDGSSMSTDQTYHLDEICASQPESLAELVDALKEGGGATVNASAHGNRKFLSMLDDLLPELRIYCCGAIQTSPGVVEVEGSYTEYYRTIGAMIALLACYATAHGDDFGLEIVSAGDRGPMSMDKSPGKFTNIGTKPDQYKKFCEKFAGGLEGENDWWTMLVFLAVHDVGKADLFRDAVNATLPKHKQSDDHDRALAVALRNPELRAKWLPSVHRLNNNLISSIAASFATNFQLPQLGQGEVACRNFKGLLAMPKETFINGTLRYYFYHSIFDIAGSACNEHFIFPLALIPVYIGLSASMDDLLEKLAQDNGNDEKTLYFDFLYANFKKAFPDFEKKFSRLAKSKVFRKETGLALLRILALTRNTYNNPEKLLDALLDTHHSVVHEMCGNSVGPEIMLYYAPDLLRMGLGTDMDDNDGENINAALEAFTKLYRVARKELLTVDQEIDQFELNVQPAVSAIKSLGKDWGGGKQLKQLCETAGVKANDYTTEGILVILEGI